MKKPLSKSRICIVILVKILSAFSVTLGKGNAGEIWNRFSKAHVDG